MPVAAGTPRHLRPGPVLDCQYVAAEVQWLAMVSAETAVRSMYADAWHQPCAMMYIAERLPPPRHGDWDEGQVLMLDALTPDRRPSPHSQHGALIGPPHRWPATEIRW
jgi:hypothetical protein